MRFGSPVSNWTSKTKYRLGFPSVICLSLIPLLFDGLPALATPKISSSVFRLLESLSDSNSNLAMTALEKPIEVPVEIFRKDYKPPAFKIIETNLDFKLDFDETTVDAVIEFRRNDENTADIEDDLVLDGDELTLLKIQLESPKGSPSRELCEFNGDFAFAQNGKLRISGRLLPPEFEPFVLTTRVRINPAANTELMGLYKAGPMLCTQCEAEGFRRITYFIDRPDVMSKFKVRLEASKSLFPVLLSNGNEISRDELPDGRHAVVFVDPFPKASYLFAVVAGDLSRKQKTFIRSTGEPVKINLWSEPKDAKKLEWAMHSVELAMKWDEVRFGRVYDLDVFNLVAVPFFNMGAMENKSLNLFNSAALLASSETSSDAEFLRIMAVVGHEYFHNWSGNRVTCRDWFQITLKEGFTNFRDHEFSCDHGSRAVERIQQVAGLRSSQFVEDAGPLAHPIRPESYVAVDNFYTTTVYEKGSEVIRMYQTILGEEGFRRGTDLYFAKFDGHAVTCDDFFNAMQEANPNQSLGDFSRWYSQSGTPEVAVVESSYDSEKQEFKLTLAQHTPPTPLQQEKLPLFIPVKLGLLGRNTKKDILSPTSQVVFLTEPQQVFTFSNVPEAPIPSLLRDFSAPVRLLNGLSDEDLCFLYTHDSDPFNRWDAGQQLMSNVIISRTEAYRAKQRLEPLAAALSVVLRGMRTVITEALNDAPSSDLSFLSECLLLPTVSNLISMTKEDADPVAFFQVRSEIQNFIAEQFRDDFQVLYDRLTKQVQEIDYDLQPTNIAARKMRNLSMSYLSRNREATLAKQHFDNATNMNDRVAGLAVLTRYSGKETDEALEQLLASANGDDNVIDKWFSLQASGENDETLERVKNLLEHPLFNMANPNRVRALISRFAYNPPQFHRADGAGYSFLANNIMQLDKVNSRIAARLAGFLTNWRRFDSTRQVALKKQLQRVAATPGLSPDTMEIVSKALQM